MDNFKDQIIGLTFGIRYLRSFRIPDVSGNIVDDILCSTKSPFNTDRFPKIQESPREKILYNPSTWEYLRVNTDDIIIAIKVDKDFKEKFRWLKEQVLGYFKNTLFKDHHIKNIKRIGVVFTHKISRQKAIDDAIEKLTNSTVTSVENVSFSFSRKEKALEALYRKGVTDYKNTIFNFTEIDNFFLAELDFQYHYNPTIEDLRECFSDKVLDDAHSFLEQKYYSWLVNLANHDENPSINK